MMKNEAGYSSKVSSSQPPTQGKIFAAYAMQNGPSPNITNRALSLSTNLGKPGQGMPGMTGQPKNKQ